MSSTKRYKLLKDMAYVKAGAIYKWDGNGYTCCTPEYFIKGLVKYDSLGILPVENNPEWFELVEDERIEVQISGCDLAGWMTTIRPVNNSHKIPISKHHLIKEAIEKVLNGEYKTNTQNLSINQPDININY